jgi:murein DD-endopeptidase MepM/ murein hydrolase activator NlpD
VANLKTSLSQDARELQRLQSHQQTVFDGLRQREAEIQQKFEQQTSLVNEIQAKRKEAAASIAKLQKKRRQEIAAQLASTQTIAGGGGSVPGGIFQTCPVGQPRAFGDDFGAPRYAGGYHLHMGNDILAPMGTPIYAPFDGTATNASNGLGGLSVDVHGAAGFVYNAHLSRLGQLGAVHAGDVIGYVGNSGDAQGGPTHDHFEWHPNSIPSNWPSSSYGYSVIDGAVNPHPILEQVC